MKIKQKTKNWIVLITALLLFFSFYLFLALRLGKNVKGNVSQGTISMASSFLERETSSIDEKVSSAIDYFSSNSLEDFPIFDFVEIEALAQWSPFSLHIDYNNIYFGEKASSQVGVTVLGWDLGSYEESQFMDCLSGETIISSGESHVVGVSAGGYLIIGASVSAGLNIDYIANEFQYIWW